MELVTGKDSHVPSASNSRMSTLKTVLATSRCMMPSLEDIKK